MHADPVRVRADLDQESVSQVIADRDLAAVPVVDAEGRMQGIVTVDDIVDVVREEATEDIQKIGGTVALEAPYLHVGLLSMVGKRLPWLTVLFLGQFLTTAAMTYFEGEMARALVLALFIPLIISSGGNSGAQASTLVIRAMGMGEVRLRDWWRVLRRELGVGWCSAWCWGRSGWRASLLLPAASATDAAPRVAARRHRRHQPGLDRALGRGGRRHAAVPAAAPGLRPRQRLGTLRGDALRCHRDRDLFQRRDGAAHGDAALAPNPLDAAADRMENAPMPNATFRSRAWLLFLAVSLAVGAAGCKTRPLVAPAPILAAETPEQTRAAILRALIESDYVIVGEKPGEIVARYRGRDWNMVVAVDYSNEVTVRYVSSEGLDYGSAKGVPVIHRGYNKRVQDLSDEIGTEIAIARATSLLPPVAMPPPGEVRAE